MSVAEKTRWKDWADALRQEMMTGLTPQVTRTVDEIISETETTKAESTVRSSRFWESSSSPIPREVLTRAGFEIEFEPDSRNVVEITLRLNASWMSILQRVRDRQKT